MNKQEIMEIMPHRDPMLLLESVELNEYGEAVGTYTVKGDEFFLQGHFPSNPIVPGVILCEIMAQTACIIFKDKPQWTTLLTGLKDVKFKRPVKPGDTVVTTCSVLKNKGPFHFCKGAARVNGEIRAQAEFSFALLPPENNN